VTDNDERSLSEVWRPLPGSSTYEISSRGRIRDTDGGKLRRPTTTLHGELVVNVKLSGKWSVRLVRSLVALAYLGPKPNRHMLVHKDGDRSNCAVENLMYVPRRFKVPADRAERSSFYSSKLSANQVQEIRLRGEKGEQGRQLARQFGVSEPHISYILAGKKR
jgi:hypothetical protein